MAGNCNGQNNNFLEGAASQPVIAFLTFFYKKNKKKATPKSLYAITGSYNRLNNKKLEKPHRGRSISACYSILYVVQENILVMIK